MSRRRIVSALTALALVGAALPVHAQTSIDELRPGDRVRVWLTDPPFRGVELQVRRVDPQVLVVARPRWADTMLVFREVIPWQSLTRIDVQTGRVASARYRRVAVLGGFALGMAAGFTAGMIADSHPYSEGEGVMVLTPLGTLAGGIVGLLVGNHGSAIWHTIPAPGVGREGRE